MFTITDFLNKYSVLTSVNNNDIIHHLKLSLTTKQYILLHEETVKLLNGSENFDQKIAHAFLKLLNKFNYLILTADSNDPVSFEHYRGQELELININYDQLNNYFKLFTGLKTLICSKCLIPRLKDIFCEGIDLEEYKSMKILQLNSCKLKSIDDSIILFRNLSSLNLSRNKLKEFKITQLGLTNLKNLDLSFNFLTSLNFIQTNMETNLDAKPLENLKCLYVQNNNISSLRGVEKFGNLKILDASNNLISILKSTIFLKRLKKLFQLNLNNNPIVFLRNYREILIKNLHASAAAYFNLDGKDLTHREKSTKMNENFDIYDPTIDNVISNGSIFESMEHPLPRNSTNIPHDNDTKYLPDISDSLTTPANLSAARIRAFLASETYSDYNTGSTDTNPSTDNYMENYDLPISQSLLVKKSKLKNKQSTNTEVKESFNKLENSLGKEDKTLVKNINNKSFISTNKGENKNIMSDFQEKNMQNKDTHLITNSAQYTPEISNLLDAKTTLNIKAEKSKSKNTIFASVDVHSQGINSLTSTEVDVIKKNNVSKVFDNNINKINTFNENVNDLRTIKSIFESPYAFNILDFTRKLNNVENICFYTIKKKMLLDYNLISQCLETERSMVIESDKSFETSDIYDGNGAKEILNNMDKRHSYSIKIWDPSSSNYNSLCTVGNHWLYFVDEEGLVNEKFDLRSLKKATMEKITEGKMIDNIIGHNGKSLEEDNVVIKLIFDTLKRSRKKRVLIMQSQSEAQELLDVVNSFIRIVIRPKMECLKCEYIFEDINSLMDNSTECPKCSSTTIVQTNKPLAKIQNSSWANFFKMGESEAKSVPSKRSLFGGNFGIFGTSWSSSKNPSEILSSSFGDSSRKNKTEGSDPIDHST